MRLIFISIFICFSYTAKSQTLDYVFKSGEDGYKCFRIPTILKSKNGTLLAFAEGRKNSCSDTGDIDLVLKKSFDNGSTWSDLQLIWNDGNNTCGNPSPVLDEKSGRISLLSTWNRGEDKEWQIIDQKSIDTRRIFLIHSNDDGHSWTNPKEITRDVKLNNWTWYATGPVNGIQLKKGGNKGRLIIPCDHIEAKTKHYYSHIIYSDDGGLNWTLGGSTNQHQVNECTIVELNSGELLLNMRNYTDDRLRKLAVSKDQGITWSDIYSHENLIEPICQASMINVKRPFKKDLLAFSNPNSKKLREKMTIQFSFNNSKTWSKKILIHEGPSAYSNLMQVNNSEIACLFEGGEKSAYEGIAFKKISIKNLKK
tara:strand:+ start:2085 stop:3188 length:1104 start_codon:yes stop_codon:yes gene_type:complete